MLRPMIEPRHRWVFPEPLRVTPEFRAAAREQGVGTFAATVLARRGVADASALAAFLGPAASGLNDPRLLPDADRLLDRVAAARNRGERAMVFGDFDADGLTGLAQLVLALRRLGIDTVPYVPSRLEEGHGLSLAAVEAAATGGVSLIVTVDTGSTSVAEVDAARARGIDVVITDHHRLPEVLPAAVALVNPHRADARYPDAELSGSGVAFTAPACCSASCWDPRRRRWSWRTSPPSGPSRTSHRSWARTARSPGWAWSACTRHRARASPRCWRGPASRPRPWISRTSGSRSRPA